MRFFPAESAGQNDSPLSTAERLRKKSLTNEKNYFVMNVFMKKTNAFTLIELLLVMGIIGVLAVFALLALNPLESQKKSRDAKRIKDLGTLATILEQYISDGNDTVITYNNNPGGNWADSSICKGNYAAGPPASMTCQDPPPFITDTQQKCNAAENFMGFNFCKYTYTIPTDPANGQQKTYVGGGGGTATMGYHVGIDPNAKTYEINSYMESEANVSRAEKDGGTSLTIFETGTDPDLDYL